MELLLIPKTGLVNYYYFTYLLIFYVCVTRCLFQENGS